MQKEMAAKQAADQGDYNLGLIFVDLANQYEMLNTVMLNPYTGMFGQAPSFYSSMPFPPPDPNYKFE